MDTDDHGHYFAVVDEAGNLCNVYLPDELFTYPVNLIEGTPIHTLSPLALYQIRAGLGITRSFGGLRPKDMAVQRRLRTAFFAYQAEAALRPRIERTKYSKATGYKSPHFTEYLSLGSVPR